MTARVRRRATRVVLFLVAALSVPVSAQVAPAPPESAVITSLDEGTIRSLIDRWRWHDSHPFGGSSSFWTTNAWALHHQFCIGGVQPDLSGGPFTGHEATPEIYVSLFGGKFITADDAIWLKNLDAKGLNLARDPGTQFCVITQIPLEKGVKVGQLHDMIFRFLKKAVPLYDRVYKRLGQTQPEGSGAHKSL